MNPFVRNARARIATLGPAPTFAWNLVPSPSLAGLLALALGARLDAQQLFRLDVDPAAATPIADATGRHALVAGAVADVDPGVDVVPGSLVATNVLAPDGSRAVFFTGAWLEITNTNPAYADDLVLPANRRRTLSLWFRSPGNGAYDAAPGYPDRMHAVGFGTAVKNLEVDFGDADHGSRQATETACWTYWDGDGFYRVVETGSSDRNLYLDDAWHHYVLVHDSAMVRAYVDDVLLDEQPYGAPLGSNEGAQNCIGRASLHAETIGTIDPFPWFGYIAGFAIEDSDATPPTIVCPTSIHVIDQKGGTHGSFVFFGVSASDDTDPAPSLVCVPPSGSFFPRGRTIVTCTATDATGNSSVATFPVFVIPTVVRNPHLDPDPRNRSL